MNIWTFVHTNTPFHVYELLAIVLTAVMLVSAIIHIIKNNKKDKEESGTGAEGGDK